MDGAPARERARSLGQRDAPLRREFLCRGVRGHEVDKCGGSGGDGVGLGPLLRSAVAPCGSHGPETLLARAASKS